MDIRASFQKEARYRFSLAILGNAARLRNLAATEKAVQRAKEHDLPLPDATNEWWPKLAVHTSVARR